ncbi:MAG: Rho GTPase activation protein [Benjaminiella poitrasii]|nr:MAG: Rho GTPase activation protein [Benjaminiella poitrasii]
MDSLQMEINISHGSFDAAANIDSAKDLQLFSLHCQSLGYIKPTPVRYENYYMEGKCKEVLFGGSLETYAVEHNKTVPLLVIKCIDAIESMGGLQREGIYRISGRQANVDQLKHQFELDEERVTAEGFDVFTIATVLKMYIRELKRPLFDFNVQTRSAYSKNMPQLQRFNLLETKLSNLSLAHRSTLYYIIHHLSKVNAHSQANKMNISNLAMIFTPVIFHDFNQTDENMPAGNPEWSPDELFEDLILHHEYLFPKSEEIARRLNEPKLHQALNGQSPFCQYSQSNLLYLMPAQQQQQQQTTPSHPATLLLTQPMNPPMANHPPKLTTLIGTVPNSMTIPETMTAVPVANNNSRVVANSNDARIPPPPQQHYPTSEAVVPTINYTPPETSRSKSLARESSNNNNETRPHYLPPRQDSLARKSAKNQERPIAEEHQYQASLDYSLLDQRSNEIQ